MEPNNSPANELHRRRPKKLTYLSKRGTPTYGTLPTLLMSCKDVSPAAKLIWAYLAFRQGKNETAWPSQETIAEHTGLSRSTVSRAGKELEKHGWLIIHRFYHDHVRHNSYVTLVPELLIENAKLSVEMHRQESQFELKNVSKLGAVLSQNDAVKTPIKTPEIDSFKNTICETPKNNHEMKREMKEFIDVFSRLYELKT